MKRFYFLVALLIGLIVVITACGGPAPAEVVDAHVKALNAGDITALAAIYTDDVVFSFGPVPPEGAFETLTGKTEVLADDLESIAKNGQLTLSNTSVEGDTVKGEFSFTDDELKDGGVDQITGTFEIMVQGGKIASIKPTLDTETQQKIAAAFAPPSPQNLTVLVGAGQDTVAILGFFPETTSIRAGDTITWKMNSDVIHSVSFGGEELIGEELVPIPGGGATDVMLNPQIAFSTSPPGAPVETYNGARPANSGIMKNVPLGPGAPLNDTFTVTFDAPGVYGYVCQIHPFAMRGEVVVEEATAQDVPSQAEIDALAEAELTPLLAQIDTIKAEADKTETQVSGPDGSSIWRVQAGGLSRDDRVELLEFLPKDIVIQEGDTVVWTSPNFHNVAFHPGRMHPEWVMPEPQEKGPPVLVMNPEVVFPARPAAAFDGTGYWSAGLIGIGDYPARDGLRSLTGGSTFIMNFSKAGTYKYMCAFHREFGMEGTVTVVQR